MALPVVITAFAFEEDQQSREGHLDYLIEEKIKIIEILNKKNEQIHHIDIINPTPDKIIQTIEDNKRNLCIFHFSGHANQEYLKTHQFNTRGEGIAGIMEECYALKLVILNGCNTNGQVPFFIKNQVPCIIGTSAKIGDITAKNFAVSFYNNFFEKCDSLEKSFEDAIIVANTTMDIEEIKVVRSLGEDPTNQNKTQEWILSSTVEMLNLHSENLDETSAYQPNKKIFELLKKLKTDVEFENEAIKVSSLTDEQLLENHREKFLNLFPLPIANRLQKLVYRLRPDEEANTIAMPFKKRVTQIMLTFQTITELSSAIILAQLWDALEFTENKATLSDDFKSGATELLQDLFDSTNKLPLFQQVLSWFSEKQPILKFNNCKDINNYFLNRIRNNKPKLEESALFFKEISSKLKSKAFSEREARIICNTAENHLCEWLDFSLILCRYKLLSIQNINLLQYRDEKKLKYDCKVFSFAGISQNPYNIDVLDYAAENSVILIDRDAFSNKNLKNYLNLSPFLIDSFAIDDKKAISGLYYPINLDKTNKGFQYKNITSLTDKEEGKVYYINGKKKDLIIENSSKIPDGTEEISSENVYRILENQINYFGTLFK